MQKDEISTFYAGKDFSYDVTHSKYSQLTFIQKYVSIGQRNDKDGAPIVLPYLKHFQSFKEIDTFILENSFLSISEEAALLTPRSKNGAIRRIRELEKLLESNLQFQYGSCAEQFRNAIQLCKEYDTILS